MHEPGFYSVNVALHKASLVHCVAASQRTTTLYDDRTAILPGIRQQEVEMSCWPTFNHGTRVRQGVEQTWTTGVAVYAQLHS